MSTVSAPESPADEGYFDDLRSGIRWVCVTGR
jgi:hypothetical protein